MTRCSEYRPKLLDYRYGLLDAAEAKAVRTHLTNCKACETAWAEAGRQQKLIAKAAKGVGPVVQFAAPAAPVTPATPARTATVRASFLGWAAVAAGLVLAVGVVGVPAARDVAAYSRAKPAVETALANLTRVRADRTAAEVGYTTARKNHDVLVNSWAEADRAKPDVSVHGPAVPVSGAPNEYMVSVGGQADGFEAVVKDDAGRVIHSQTFPAGTSTNGLRLPPEAWAGVKPGSDLTLHVSAGGTTADPVRLAGPAYATFLTTDKPLYRPGEAVYFRSLTLDRVRFLPPAKDLALWYELRSPTGQVVPGCELTGLAQPAVERNGKLAPVEGPDGKPVRGVGTGVFALPADLAGGEYTLAVYEATAAGDKTKPQAAKKIVVVKPNANPTVPPEHPAAGRVVLEFYPEGGDLVVGVPNRVYVRAATNAGQPVEAYGVVSDGTTDVCRFESYTDPSHAGVNRGLGEFTFTPEAGKKYSAKLDAATFPLPAAKPEGVVLTVADGVTDPGEPIKLTLTSAGAKRSLWVGAYVRGVPVAHARTVTEPGQPVDVVLQPSDEKLGGVTRITVFEEVADGADKPLAERLVFRRPGQQLKLGVTTEHANDTVRLDVTAATEADAPTPAVLWAAVVHHAAATADGPAHRSLPAHFYLAGEVQNPDELEQADFLLTDHPAAEKSLDLVLGTQGWRRFAEQTPDRLRQSFGTRDAAFAEYWPKYEAAHARLVEARQRLTDASDDGTAVARTTFLAAVGEVDAITNPGRRAWRFAAVAGLLVAGLGLLAVRRRGPALAGVTGCVVLAGAVGVSLAVTGGSRDWREAVDVSAPLALALPSAEVPPLPETKEFASKPDPKSPKMEPMTAGNTSARVRSMTLPELSGPPPATRVRNEPVAGGTAFQWTPEFAELAKSPSAAEFCKRVMELADTNVPRVPPLVVREYAHRPNGGMMEHVETVLWQPVLVVPGSGTASVTFAVGNADAPYQVLVAGHTLDGRIGAVTTKIEVQFPKQP